MKKYKNKLKYVHCIPQDCKEVYRFLWDEYKNQENDSHISGYLCYKSETNETITSCVGLFVP